MDNEKLSQKFIENLVDTEKEKLLVQIIFERLEGKKSIERILDSTKEHK